MRKHSPIGDEEMLSLPDCRFLNEKGGCERLSFSRCTGEKCTFFSPGKSGTDLSGWKSRLSLLSEEEQSRIAKKYYGGKRPWKDGGGDVV
ncbi:MAG: hypothetical protein ACI4J0_10840 [Huintestinicola sp.]|uniref:hypothetical protein n=1 Tax=Huintestinicola sp. TaxID=2981661 RepID=UPI003F05199D